MSQSKVQIFIVPFAGGSIDFFGDFVMYLGVDFESFAFEYPAHGRRIKEKNFASFDEAVDETASYILSHRDKTRPYIIFAYSMGCIIASAILEKYLQVDLPIKVFFASHFPPHATYYPINPLKMSDDDFIEMVRPLGGITPEMAQDRIFRRVYLQILKKDFFLLHDFKWSGQKKYIHSDLTVLYSSTDPHSTRVVEWCDYTDKKFSMVEFSGGHFFLKDHAKEVAEMIKSTVGETNVGL